MMNKFYGHVALVLMPLIGLVLLNEQPDPPTFQRIEISNEFYGEGAGIGDLNGNGLPDVVCGPFWYEAPDFKRRHAFYEEPVPFNLMRYGDSNSISVSDVNGDGWNDILVVGWRGLEAFWYENPGESGPEEGGWMRHVVYPSVDNEASWFYDLTGDGQLELIFHTEGYLGYAAVDPSDPTAPWNFVRVSEQAENRTDGHWGKWHHGIGIGDVNGDGHNDFIMNEGWWENPGTESSGSIWRHHSARFGDEPMQMYAYDVDGDGLNDVIASIDAHGWGLAWYRQIRSEGGEISFEENLIMGSRLSDNPYGVRFSQPHAVVLADLNGDGLKDIVTGKRYFAHGPLRDDEPLAPPVVYGFILERGEGGKVNYVPHLIDDNSGVGNQISAGDITGNGYPDIVTCNKKGGFIFLNRSFKR